MAKNQSLPARLREKNSQGEHNLTMYGHHEKPTVWWLRPSLSNPRSINDIVWAFLRANSILFWVVTNCVLTSIMLLWYNISLFLIKKREVLQVFFFFLEKRSSSSLFHQIWYINYYHFCKVSFILNEPKYKTPLCLSHVLFIYLKRSHSLFYFIK